MPRNHRNPFWALILATLFAVAAWPAEARTLRIDGSSGYLSEWEVKAEVTSVPSGGREEFSGPLTLRHIGLCSPNGAVEKTGQIKFHISKSLWSADAIHATLTIDGSQCTYEGKLSGRSSGFMECPGGKAIPLVLSVE
jgi:hypothetical protein